LTVEERIEAMVEGSPMSLLHPHNRRYVNDTAPAPAGAVNTHDHAGGDANTISSILTSVRGMPESAPVTRDQVQRAWNARATMQEKMQGYEQTGSTVFVHEVKQEAWWIETALALMGTEAWAGSGIGDGF
jgi:hypothetical protein